MDEYQPIVENRIDWKELINLSLNPFPCHIFRGHGSSSYSLVPSIYREKGISEIKNMVKNYSFVHDITTLSPEVDDLGYLEYASLLLFNELSNDQGLVTVNDIPHSLNLILDSISTYYKHKERLWNHSLETIAGIAQHYGLPTRLLDWTTDFNVAIYFATSDAFRLIRDNSIIPSENIAIWIMNKELAKYVLPELHLFKPDYHTNPNIKSQSGLFSILRNADENQRKKPLEEIILNAFNEKKDKNAETLRNYIKLFNNDPILRKIIMPYSDLEKLHENLMHRGINANRYFPGYNGVVKTMREFGPI